jgi:hypothetical protein
MAWPPGGGGVLCSSKCSNDTGPTRTQPTRTGLLACTIDLQ